MRARNAQVVLLALAAAVTASLAVACSDSVTAPPPAVSPTNDVSSDDLPQSDLETDIEPDMEGDEQIGDTDDGTGDADGGTDDGGAGSMMDTDGGSDPDAGTDDGSTDDGGTDDGSGDDGSVDDGDGSDPGSTDPDPNDDPYANGGDEAITITRGVKNPPNVGFGGRWRTNKIGGWVVATNTCDATPLHYTPSPGSALVKNARGADVHLAKSRPVVVQMAPGLHDGYVWVDPDLSSFSSARNKATFGSLITRSTPYVGARGWVRADCLKPGQAKGRFPTKHVVHPAGDALQVKGTVTPMTLKKNDAGNAVACDVRARYSHSKGAGYANYGPRNAYAKGIYLTYNTPSATYKGTVRGGGVSGGYLTIEDTFNVVAKVDDKAVQKNKSKNPKGTLAVSFGKLRGVANKGADDQHPGLWAYGYIEQDGARTWGYVYADCLGESSAPPPATGGDDCTGKADGEYCGSLGDQSYICKSGKISGGNACPSGQSCMADDSGKKIDCE